MNTIERRRVRYPLQVRTVTVTATRTLTPSMVRISFGGDDVAGFIAPAPADHVKMFFPDPNTGNLVVPQMTETGLVAPPGGVVIARDYTPAHVRTVASGRCEVDIDFFIHDGAGPAVTWAQHAAVGQQLAWAGPRGSHLPPTGWDAAVIIADETALPAAARWLTSVPHDIPVSCLASVRHDSTGDYLPASSPGRDIHWFTGQHRQRTLEDFLRRLPKSRSMFFFLAGEAGDVAPLRRYLRRELGLPKECVDAQGYWKRSVTGFDHHAPVDPRDPD